ncbi:MAG: hypothetical protein K940chlam1_00273 [Candidatus Anoxychlamydiales bacterium]|nr:hypothetical protein [Candidatus Anoxychlamydiales bacterium]NGX35595.1 hypothetical protein [Candidatus Anoxychlamydiales bacterium]
MSSIIRRTAYDGLFNTEMQDLQSRMDLLEELEKTITAEIEKIQGLFGTRLGEKEMNRYERYDLMTVIKTAFAGFSIPDPKDHLKENPIKYLKHFINDFRNEEGENMLCFIDFAFDELQERKEKVYSAFNALK